MTRWLSGAPTLTLQARLTFWYTGTLVCILSLYAVLVFLLVEHGLWDQLDRRLHDDAEAEQSLLMRSKYFGVVRMLPVMGRGGADDVHDRWIEIWSLDGRRLYQSPRAARATWSTYGPPRFRVLPAGVATIGPPVAPAVHSLRVGAKAYMRVHDETGYFGGERVFVRVAESEDPPRKQLAKLLWTMVFGMPIAVGAAALGGYHLARRALQQVDRVAEREKSPRR